MKKFENFCKALNNLQLAREVKEPYDVLSMTGSVALFEICFEQAWKAMKEILSDQGFSAAQTGSPKQILKMAYSAGMVRDEEKWLAMLASRNEVSHSYNEEVAQTLLRAVQTDYIDLLEELRTELKTNWIG